MSRDRPIAQALAQFQRTFPIRHGEDLDATLARARAQWQRHIARAVRSAERADFAAAYELAWLLLDDAAMAALVPDDDDPDASVARHRSHTFMALAPDVSAWSAYLLCFPPDAATSMRVGRAARARLLHGSVHPDAATLVAPPRPVADFVRAHLDGPDVCLSCRRQLAPERVDLMAAASQAGATLEVVVRTRDVGSAEIAVRLSLVEDEGWLRARLEPVDPTKCLDGSWHIGVVASDARATASLKLPEQRWHGINLGRADGFRAGIQRVEVHATREPEG